ncbi:MAG: hypothetical protein QM779_05470 [Propionicimonas sp.]|uniref:hypothetical protein n=1 Tax=Propionicimonas sp. TaxID=1955623 RepID=UPI003D0B3886
MAEIRKFDPAAGSAIAQALKAAMGEPVRPVAPGDAPVARHTTPEPPATTSWVSLQVNTTIAAGGDRDEETDAD